MALILTNERRWQLTLLLLGIPVSLWAWTGAVKLFHINESGFAGVVALILWGFYLFMFPLIAFVLFLVSIESAMKGTEPWPKPIGHAAIAVGAVLIWLRCISIGISG